MTLVPDLITTRPIVKYYKTTSGNEKCPNRHYHPSNLIEKIAIKLEKHKKRVVARHQRKLIGYLAFEYPNDLSEKRNVNILEIYVQPQLRRLGIATKLLEYFLQYFKKTIVWVSLWTGKQIEIQKGLKLYTRLGFKSLAYQEDYYAKNVGTHLYGKKLSDS
jgi:ribosomal protein S18 acetylase RimI-like enzyme